MSALLRARILVTLSRADVAWLAILAIAIGVDLTADEDGTLSQRLNGYRPRWLWRAMVLLTAAHLIRVIPPWCDVWSLTWLVTRRVRHRPNVRR